MKPSKVYPRPLGRGARAMVHILVERGGSASTKDLSWGADIALGYVRRSISECRVLAKSLGGTISSEGDYPDRVFTLEGVDYAELIKRAGPVELVAPVARSFELVGARWTPELDAQILRWRELNKSAAWIANEIGAGSRDVVLGRLYRLGQGGYGGGKEPKPEAPPAPVRLTSISLPRVGGICGYASGKLIRDGVPVEGRV